MLSLLLVSCNKDTDTSPIIQFKDPNFLKAILWQEWYGYITDTNEDGQISENEAASSIVLQVDYNSAPPAPELTFEPVICVDEIRYFTNLLHFSCMYNQLTSLDVSKNTALERLQCGSNKLTQLDISKNTLLKGLICGDNQLTSLDVSKNIALEDLICNNNQLTELDLSNNINLKRIKIDQNIGKIILTRDIYDQLRQNYDSDGIYSNILKYMSKIEFVD